MLKSNKTELKYCQNSVISGVVKMREAVIINYNKSCFFILFSKGQKNEWARKKSSLKFKDIGLFKRPFQETATD